VDALGAVDVGVAADHRVHPAVHRQRGAFGHPAVQVGRDFVPVRGGDQRAHLRVLVGARADPQRAHPFADPTPSGWRIE